MQVIQYYILESWERSNINSKLTFIKEQENNRLIAQTM